MNRKRILIVGGVAGGASCAARARRLSEDAEIVLFDRGPYVSFANCGLPYYVGNVIAEEKKLLVASTELFKTRFNIEVRTENEVTAIDRQRREIEIKRLKNGEIYREKYDALLLAPGAAPIRPPLPGVDLHGIFVLRNIPDSRRIPDWIVQCKAESAVIVGAGLVGLEMAENLVARGIAVTVVEMLDQVLPPLDPEMAEPVRQRLLERGVAVQLGDAVAGFEQDSSGTLFVNTQSQARFPADLVILSIGVRPEVKLASEAGLEIGRRGGIRVDDAMRTSDPYIWAVGDAVEIRDIITAKSCLVALAGPANRQGRIAADSICGREASFRGVQSTGVIGIFGLTIAFTGASEKALQRSGVSAYEKVYLHPGHHVGYYPGARPIHIKLLFSSDDGRVLGAQAVGEEGVERRIDVIATLMQMCGTVFDLSYNAAFASGVYTFIPQFRINGATERYNGEFALLLDVREPSEFEAGHLPSAVNIPLPELRSRLCELPRNREIWTYCGVGQRSYYALRIFLQHGFAVKNLPGGYSTYKHLRSRLQLADALSAISA